MKVEWKNNKEIPSLLIKEIKDRLSISSDGEVAFRTDFDFLFDALFEKVRHSFTLDDAHLFEIFKWSVLEAFGNEKLIKSEEILRLFKIKCEEACREKDHFTLVTSINLNSKHLPKRRDINGCKVRFYQTIPKKYLIERNKIINDSPENDLADQENFLFLCVKTEAPNKETAFLKALETVDLIRALWQIGFEKSIRLSSNRKDQEYFSDSVISTGKLHTLHSNKGINIPDGQWIEENYRNRKAIGIKNFSLTDSLLGRQARQIKSSPFKDHIIRSLTSYANALDHDQEFRFMKLWTVLEQLLGSDNSKKLIKMTTFFFKDREVEKSVLESLRSARNMNAHVGIKPFNIEMKNFRLCQYIEWILKIFIDNSLDCEKLIQMTEIASSPTDLKTIDEQIKRLELVRKYIGARVGDLAPTSHMSFSVTVDSSKDL